MKKENFYPPPFDNNRPDTELERTVGELVISRYQSRRLKRKLSEKVAGYIHVGGGYYRRNSKAPISKLVFYHKNKLYRVSLVVEEIAEPKDRKESIS